MLFWLITIAGVAVLSFIARDPFALHMPFWNRDRLKFGIGLWSGIVVVTAVIFGVMFGVATLMSMWTFFGYIVVLGVVWFGVGWFKVKRQEGQTLKERYGQLSGQNKHYPWLDDYARTKGWDKANK